jgi:hypothetical protein
VSLTGPLLQVSIRSGEPTMPASSVKTGSLLFLVQTITDAPGESQRLDVR